MNGEPTITVNLTAVLVFVLLTGGGLIVFFLQRIYGQFEKMVDTVNSTVTRVTVLEGKVEKLDSAVEDLRRAA